VNHTGCTIGQSEIKGSARMRIIRRTGAACSGVPREFCSKFLDQRRLIIDNGLIDSGLELDRVHGFVGYILASAGTNRSGGYIHAFCTQFSAPCEYSGTDVKAAGQNPAAMAGLGLRLRLFDGGGRFPSGCTRRRASRIKERPMAES
jgi:hypothetical protein